MVDSRIKLDTAIIAKAKNFDAWVDLCYVQYKKSYVYDSAPEHLESHKEDDVYIEKISHINGASNMDLSNNLYVVYARPTQALLQKWLREVHNIRVYPTQKIAGDFGFEIYIKNEENPAGSPFKRVSYFTQHFNSYEEAIEKGLQEALNLIILNTD
jgi:hypothetical protein